MKKFLVSHLNGVGKKVVLDAAEIEPVEIVTGASRHGKRKPLVLMSLERYEALKAVVEEAKR